MILLLSLAVLPLRHLKTSMNCCPTCLNTMNEDDETLIAGANNLLDFAANNDERLQGYAVTGLSRWLLIQPVKPSQPPRHIWGDPAILCWIQH